MVEQRLTFPVRKLRVVGNDLTSYFYMTVDCFMSRLIQMGDNLGRTTFLSFQTFELIYGQLFTFHIFLTECIHIYTYIHIHIHIEGNKKETSI